MQTLIPDTHVDGRIRQLAGAFIAGYKSADTRSGYRSELRKWFAWTAAHHVDPLDVQRTHAELYARWLEQQNLATATVAHALSVLTSFYRWLVDEEILDRSPLRRVRRPRVSAESTRVGLRRTELLDWVNAAQRYGPAHYAFACLLAFNALRVGEVIRIDIDDLGESDWHHTIRITGKGDKPALVPLAPRTRRAVEAAVTDRTSGPLIVNREGRRLTRQLANIWTKNIARRAGIEKTISSHSLRHSAITAALNAGVDLRDVQDFARHTDPRTTMRYDRARRSLDRHATYIVTQYVSGAK